MSQLTRDDLDRLRYEYDSAERRARIATEKQMRAAMQIAERIDERRRRDMQAQLVGGLIVGALFGGAIVSLAGWFAIVPFLLVLGYIFYRAAR